jgi:hypothetical protein
MQLPRLERAAQRVAGLVEEMNLEIDGQDVPSVFRAWELLSSRLDCGGADADGSELKARRTEVDDALALLHEQALSLPRADQIRVAAEAIKAPDGWDETAKSSLSSDKDALREAVGELIAAPALDDAREAYASVVAAGTAILELAKNTEPQALRIAVAEAITLGFSAELAQVTAAAEEPQPPEGLGGLVAPAPPPSSEELRRRFKLTERQMATLSGLLAVLSGLLALYVSSDTWGAPGDYLKAILWGSVVSEGVKYVAALVARTGPAT